MNMNSLLKQLCCLIIISLSSCFPYHGNIQKKVRQDPLKVVDLETGNQIARILIIPRYTKNSGFSSGAGDGKGFGKSYTYIANPFIYNSGEKFSPVQKKSTGLMFGPAWAGVGVGNSIDGVLIIAHGYEPLWHFNLWSNLYKKEKIIRLTPLSGKKSKEILNDIFRLVQKDSLVEKERAYWSLGGDSILQVNISRKELLMIEGFIKQK